MQNMPTYIVRFPIAEGQTYAHLSPNTLAHLSTYTRMHEHVLCSLFLSPLRWTFYKLKCTVRPLRPPSQTPSFSALTYAAYVKSVSVHANSRLYICTYARVCRVCVCVYFRAHACVWLIVVVPGRSTRSLATYFGMYICLYASRTQRGHGHTQERTAHMRYTQRNRRTHGIRRT